MADRDIEEQIASLPRGAPASSFRVFAEWLKDLRQSQERRFDSQDRKLEEIHGETRRTNGRVTQLETDMKLQQVLSDGRSEWEHEVDKQTAKRDARRERRVQWVIGSIIVIVGSVSANIGQALGWW